VITELFVHIYFASV